MNYWIYFYDWDDVQYAPSHGWWLVSFLALGGLSLLGWNHFLAVFTWSRVSWGFNVSNTFQWFRDSTRGVSLKRTPKLLPVIRTKPSCQARWLLRVAAWGMLELSSQGSLALCEQGIFRNPYWAYRQGISSIAIQLAYLIHPRERFLGTKKRWF